MRDGHLRQCPGHSGMDQSPQHPYARSMQDDFAATPSDNERLEMPSERAERVMLELLYLRGRGSRSRQGKSLTATPCLHGSMPLSTMKMLRFQHQ